MQLLAGKWKYEHRLWFNFLNNNINCFFVNCRAPRCHPLTGGALGRCWSRKQTGDIAALVFLTSSFPSGFGPQPGFEPTTFPSGEVFPTDVSVFNTRPRLQIGSHELRSHMEVGKYADASLLLPHVSVTAFMSDSTSKPAPHEQGYRSCQPSSFIYMIWIETACDIGDICRAKIKSL